MREAIEERPEHDQASARPAALAANADTAQVRTIQQAYGIARS